MTDRLQQLRKLHQADPGDTFCTYGIAMEHAKLQEHAQAVQWFDRTLELDPHYHYAYYQKALMLVAMDRRADARAVVQEGLRIAGVDGAEKAVSELGQLLNTM